MQPLIEQLVASAAKAHAEGRLQEAGQLVREALELNPREPRALFLGGVVAAKSGRFEEALSLLEDASKIDANSFFIVFWLVTVLRSMGRSREALDWAQKATQRKGPPGKAMNLLGLCYLDLDDPKSAADCLRAADAEDPNDFGIKYSLGRALQAQGLNREAIDWFHKAEAIDPASAQLLTDLIETLLLESEPVEAAKEARKLLQLQPESSSAHLALARCLVTIGQVAEAEPHVRKSLEEEPSDARGLALLGSLLQSLGRIEEAGVRFKRSIELDPNLGFAYLGLTRGRRMGEADRPLVEKMIELAEGAEIPERQNGALHYAIGKAMEDLGEYGEAMRHWDKANAIAYKAKFGEAPFDRRRHQEGFDTAIQLFSKPFLDRYKTAGIDEALPIFVLGMMRSGTTLTEQILSSHPEVGGAGEQRFWPDRGEEALQSRSALDAVKLCDLSETYCASLRRLCPGKRLVVDKMPVNYSLIGLLQIAFPNAPIIHVKRHPIDTCVSAYATPNAGRIEWAHNKANIAFAYEQYLRLMEHWRSVLPAGRMLEIQYEELVSDRERVTRQMIEYCGLPWNEACLRPELNDRSVVTPSAWQVRQPVYKTSIDRWRRFEPWLGELANIRVEI